MKLEEKKQIVCNFLVQCNKYATNQIEKEQKKQDHNNIIAKSEQKIQDWQRYIEFNEYALSELRSNTLDSWFT